MEFVAETEAVIESWQDILPPNPAAKRFTSDLQATIAGFEALRYQLAFEDEPSSFLAALREAK